MSLSYSIYFIYIYQLFVDEMAYLHTSWVVQLFTYLFRLFTPLVIFVDTPYFHISYFSCMLVGRGVAWDQGSYSSSTTDPHVHSFCIAVPEVEINALKMDFCFGLGLLCIEIILVSGSLQSCMSYPGAVRSSLCPTCKLWKEGSLSVEDCWPFEYGLLNFCTDTK